MASRRSYQVEDHFSGVADPVGISGNAFGNRVEHLDPLLLRVAQTLVSLEGLRSQLLPPLLHALEHLGLLGVESFANVAVIDRFSL